MFELDGRDTAERLSSRSSASAAAAATRSRTWCELGIEGVDFICANTDAQALKALEGQDGPADRLQHHQGSRRGRESRSRPPGRDGRPRPDHRGDRRRGHAVHHRRHGRRHGHGRGAGRRAGREGARHPHGRRGHQAVRDGRRQAHARRRAGHRRARQVRRLADHDPEREAAVRARRARPRCSTRSRPRTRCCRARCRASPS